MNKITTLKDLSQIWKDRQSITTITKPEDLLTPEQIDGSSMTTNPDQKFRRARIITEADMAKYKRPNKIKEMLNYCKFRLGKLATCSKPSPMTLNVLYNYKSGKIDRIPLGYMEAIKDYRDLVDSAMTIDMRHKSNTSDKTKLETKAQKAFENWLDNLINLNVGISLYNPIYVNHIRKFKQDGIKAKLPKHVKSVLKKEQYVQILTYFMDNHTRLIHYSIPEIKVKAFLQTVGNSSKSKFENAYMTLDNIVKSSNYDDFYLPEYKKPEKVKAVSYSKAIQNKQIKDKKLSENSSYPINTKEWKNVSKGKERFRTWLNSWLGLSQDERIWKQNYAAGLYHFILEGINKRSYTYPESLRLTLHEKPYVDMLANNEIKVNMAEQTISLNNTIFRASSVLAQPIIIETNQQKDKPDSLTAFVEHLRTLGIKEFSIKF